MNPTACDDEIRLGFPCHHPAWPRHCDRCDKLANGLPIHWQFSQTHAYGIDATFCFDCHRITVQRWDTPGLTEDRVRVALARTIGYQKAEVVFLDRATYRARCVDPGAGPGDDGRSS